MVRIDLLDSFETFRTKPPIIMPESKSDRKKGQAFMVVAPSIEKELVYLATNTYIKYRYLTKYFIDKKWELSYYKYL